MKLLHGTVLAGAVASVVAVVLVACSDKSVPTAPVASATPTPVTVAPSPSPSPTLVPVAQCNLDQMPDCAKDCCFSDDDNTLYETELEVSMAAVKKAHPEMFDTDGTLAVNPSEYTDAVATDIRLRYGYCARGGDRPGPPLGHSISEDEVAIKRDNRMSQNSDIVIGTLGNLPGLVRVFTCRPASF
jgi:hypothetical protein